MGSCLSSVVRSFSDQSDDELDLTPPTAKVVSVSGNLHEYNLPVFVSQVLQAESNTSSSNSKSSNFMCNSDSLYYDDFMPAMDDEDKLHANQIYFVLPRSKLQYRLSASDMAALAVKASVAIQNANKKDSKRRNYKKASRISPVILLSQTVDNNSEVKSMEKEKVMRQPVGLSRSGSVRRLQRFTSRRAKLAVRSFKLRLSTIHEGSVLNLL